MLILQLDSVGVDAIVGALNLHSAICLQTVQSISLQVTTQLNPPEKAEPKTETQVDGTAGTPEGPDGS